MSATITWVIEYMDCKPTEGSYTDVVVTAGWRCIGTSTKGSGLTVQNVTASTYGQCSFPMPSGSFTPYPDLTQEQVLGWCYAAGVDQTYQESVVQSQINDLVNPPIVQPPLPWAPQVSASAA
jgi:hypothetical protein